MTTGRVLQREFFHTIWLEWMVTPEAMTEEESLKQVDFIERVFSLPRGSKLLDMACGHARHLRNLADRGYKMAGVDIAPDAVDLARRQLQKHGVEAELLCCDMRFIPFKSAFDGIFSMWTTFGLFNSLENRQVLVSVCQALKPGGRFILDVMSRDRLVREFQRYYWFEDAQGHKVVQERDFDPLSGRASTRWIILRHDGSTQEGITSARIYTLTELAGMLRRAGLRIVETYGNYDLSPYTYTSRRLIILAERPKPGEQVEELPPLSV